MNGLKRVQAIVGAWAICAAAQHAALAEGLGQEDFDDALRIKVTAEDVRDLNKVIDRLESALDKGLDVENSDLAEQMLVESLLERATQLTTVVRSLPIDRLEDPRIDQVRTLATSDLRRVLTYDDPPAQATVMLVHLLSLPGGDPTEAKQLLNRFIKQDDFAALPADERAEALALRATMQKSPEKALADYDAAIALAPDSVAYLLARANFHREQDHDEQALADIAAFIEKRPDDAAGYLLQADVYRDADRLDEALASVEKASQFAPKDPAIHQTRGEIYRLQQDYDRAIAEFTRVLRMAPGLALALIHRAEAYYAADKLDEALADLDTLLKEHPGLAVAHGLKAQVLAGKKQLPEAIAEMEKLAKQLPEQLEYRMQLGIFYLMNDQPRRAITAFSEALSLEASNFLALRSRANAYLNIGDHTAAVVDFAKAYKLEPDDSPLLNNYAWVLATSPDDQVRNGKLALELATRACELTKYEQPHILSTLAAAYAESGDFAKAREWSEKAVAMSEQGVEPDVQEELAKELASYRQDKPWRERQTQEDRQSETAAPAAKDPGAPAQSAEAPAPKSEF